VKPGEIATGLPRGPFLAVLAVILALGYKFFRFISDYSVNVLFYDQWDFLAPLFQGRTGFFDLFLQQHGPHREGVGLLVVRLLYSVTAWNTRAEALLLGILVFVAMLGALFLKWRLFGGLSYWDVTIPLIFLNLMQFETFLAAVNPAYSVLPLLLVVLYCLALLLANPLVRYTLVLLLNVSLIYTGFGFFMGVVTLGVFALEILRASRRAVAVPPAIPVAGLVAAAASLASFFYRYVPATAVDCFIFPYHPLLSYPWFVALLFSAFLGPRGPLLLVTAGGVAAMMFVVAAVTVQITTLVKREEADGRQASTMVITVLIGYSLLFAVNAAVGRVCLGLPLAAQPSRYSMLLVPAYLGIYFFLLSFPVPPIRSAAIPLFLLLLIPEGVTVPSGPAREMAEGKRAWAACYLKTGDIAGCDKATGFRVYPNPDQTGLPQKLEFLKRHRLSFFSEMDARAL
jgi:hypothetical protein